MFVNHGIHALRFFQQKLERNREYINRKNSCICESVSVKCCRVRYDRCGIRALMIRAPNKADFVGLLLSGPLRGLSQWLELVGLVTLAHICSPTDQTLTEYGPLV